ncbi:MAG: hypothetical protein L0196_04445, partial [candidate division Zixibacteria bacterium]|nr:hypothetical protein [candidate division Zixibacteria bacterium]
KTLPKFGRAKPRDRRVPESRFFPIMESVFPSFTYVWKQYSGEKGDPIRLCSGQAGGFALLGSGPK